MSALLIIVAIPGWADDKAKSTRSNDESGQVIEPDLQRREIEKPDIDALDFELGVYYGVLSIQDFGSNSVTGATLAYHATEDIFIEVEYGKSKGDKTSFEKLSGSAQLLDSNDRDYKYYSLNIGGNIFPGEIYIGSKYAFVSSFYATGGIGGTDFAGDSVFTVNFGVGYRVLFNDWLGIRFDVRDYIFDRDIFGERDRSNNLELRTGFSVFF
ncbi:MAG TPA: outer membrane beta-barrel domain-containing protein [Spongiibacteraceae bacterium]